MSRRNDLAIRLAMLAASLAIAVFILVRFKRLSNDATRPPSPTPPVSPTPAPTPNPTDPVREAYKALLAQVTSLMDEERYPEACDVLDDFAKTHPGTRWAQIAALNRSRLEAMRTEVEERDRRETLERIEADLALLLAAGEYDDALELLDQVPTAQRDDAWQQRVDEVTQLREEAIHAPDPEPAEHPERAALAKRTEEAERLGRQGDLAAARKAAEALSARLRQLNVPCLDEEFGPRASAVLELASLAEIEAVLPGGVPTQDLSKLTPRDRIRALTSRRDALVRFLETLPRLPQIRAELRRKLGQARRDALNTIFNKQVYPDEAHGAAGQGKVDEVVHVVRVLWDKPLAAATELDSVVRRAVEALRNANELLSRDAASGARPIEEVLEPLQERFSIHDLAADEWEQQIMDRNRVVKAWNESATTSLTKDERALLNHVNDYREMMGLRILEIEEHLVMAARWHARDMDEKKYFAHIDLEGRNPLDRAREMLYPNRTVGENCAAGVTDPARAHWGFYYSSGHHRGMLMRAWVHIGVGRTGGFWVEEFGAGPPQAK